MYANLKQYIGWVVSIVVAVKQQLTLADFRIWSLFARLNKLNELRKAVLKLI